MRCVSKVSPTEKSGQERGHSLAGGSGEPGGHCRAAVPGALSFPWGAVEVSPAGGNLLRAEMEVLGVLAVAGASSAIKIDLHTDFKIFCLFVCLFF